MTLIVTQISKHGIIHATDSNLSDQSGNTVGNGKKCFAIPKLNAGLTVAGSFEVGTSRMDKWMDDFILKSTSNSLENFAEGLRSALEKEMSDEQKSESLIHIAGYVKNGEKYHPEFWFVRNIYQLDLKTGEYSDVRKEFIKSEDFWTRDNLKDNGNLFSKFQANDSMYQIYINGFSPGRIGYNIIQNHLTQFFSNLWLNKNWKFRAPKNIDEAKLLVENYFGLINIIFILSDYPGQLIGGDIQTEIIKQPNKIEI
ncbi:MAG: hypothetical protein ABR927_14200 [Bacteroidales bacterium]|jgi:hypothetical protein